MTGTPEGSRATSRDRRVDEVLRRAEEQRKRTDRVLEETRREREVIGPVLRRAGFIR